MAGFLVQSFRGSPPSSAMKLVDLGGCEVSGRCVLGNARAAWAHWQGSKQWRVTQTANRMVLVEGQPDRWPAADESTEQWLKGRFGSFRGFEISTDPATGESKVCIFTDPLCTRPIYYFLSRDAVCISDKLASVVLNTEAAAQPDWGGLLESGALGSLYSYKTTVQGAEWISPGEALEFASGKLVRRWRNSLPLDESFSKAKVMARPAETLRLALEKAIAETWTDPETRLLLSGGLDSRIVLALAGGKRKALTLELYSNEAVITQQIADAAGATLDMTPAPDYEFLIRWGYLATGAMHESRYVSHLGLVRDWREHGIRGVTHGYFHNTIYRGWTAGKVERFPTRDSILFEWLGEKGYYFDRYGCKPPYYPRQFYELLSNEGKEALRRQMRELADSIKPVIIDGYDLTFERRLMDFVSRQIYFCVMLGWYEGVDVASPVFQPALWTWYALSHPRHRDRDWAIREVYLKLGHPAARLPDSNTGQAIAHLPVHWRDRVRNQFWYPAVRAAYKKLRKPQPYQESGMGWGRRFAQPAILAAMEDAIAVLHDNPLWDRGKLEKIMGDYRGGGHHLVSSICALAAIGEWERLVRRPESLSKHVRVFEVEQARGAESSAVASTAREGGIKLPTSPQGLKPH